MIETSLQHEPVALPERSLGRIARSVAAYGLLTALMFVANMFVFIPAALFACGMRNGRRAAWIALIFALVLTALFAIQAARVPGISADDARMILSTVTFLTLAIALPALAALPMVERGESSGSVLMLATVGGGIGLLLTEAAMRTTLGFSPYAVQLAQTRLFWEHQQIPAAYVSGMKKFLDLFQVIMPAVVLMMVVVAFVLSLALFSRLESRRSASQRGSVYLFRNLSLPDWVLFAFLFGGITPLAGGLLQKVAANVLAVVVFLYFLQGLAIFRSMLVSLGVSLFGTVVGFLLIAVLLSVAVLPLSITGLFDSFFDFRHFRRKDDSHEGHSD